MAFLSGSGSDCLLENRASVSQSMTARQVLAGFHCRSRRVGKGAVHMHGLATRTAQRCAHHLRSSRTELLMVGTVLRHARGEAVHVDRTFAHPTIPCDAACTALIAAGKVAP